MSEPIPPENWGSTLEPMASAQEATEHTFPPRPEVVVVSEADLAGRPEGQSGNEPYRPEGAPLRALPQLLRPEGARAPLWRRAPGAQDERGEPTTVFLPDTRTVIYDTSYPWRTCGRVVVPGGSGSGVMVGRRHMVTASHVVPWRADGSADWMTFTPMQYDTSAPFGSAHVTRIYFWQRVNGADGISSNEAAFDYAVCVLSNPLGDTTGWMGSAHDYVSAWNGRAYWSHIGYPGDIGSSLRPVYTANGVMDSAVNETFAGRNGLRVMHRNDIFPGQSGGPYFGWWTGEVGPHVVAEQSAENWGMAGGPNAAGGGSALRELVAHARTVEP
ncbi:trypsin-like peptidase domain-containing protein [Streptomyces sp. N2-109]|uniref:Trypsin-like peptidase domain-containing protein n=1 Tax=Streptomyces gossypii TaxID=2883101 RepID=A0ABT2JKU6_9ACTN|nr:trypsin-like peptidase domain-containing protein [Streptomyces gossypii]MCT2588502.1 trypsin-like peptidase domain-containing protein [Streptomyces gossypii]